MGLNSSLIVEFKNYFYISAASKQFSYTFSVTQLLIKL
jgi:hypothetical protein